MNMVIALCGESCVGKTIVAELLGKQLAASVRHCGEIAKTRAKALHVDYRQLPQDAHDTIDRETRILAQQTSERVSIMEGRFLDQVLNGFPNVLIVRLTCSNEERLRRSNKKNNTTTAEEVQLAKSADAGEKLHTNAGVASGTIVLNTDGLTPKEVAESVLRHLKTFPHDSP